MAAANLSTRQQHHSNRVKIHSATRPAWLTTLVPILILWLALGVRLIALNDRNFWLDESIEFNVANRPLAQVVLADQAATHDPPLYSLLLNVWMNIGREDFTLQCLSVFLSVLAVAIMLTLGRQALSMTTGLVAGLIVAVAPRSVFFGLEVNQYGLVMLLAVLCLWRLERYFQSPTRRHLAQFGIASVAAMLTHYQLDLYVAALVLIGTLRQLPRLRRQPPRQIIEWLGLLGGLVAIGAILLFAYALPQKARLPSGFAPAFFATAPPIRQIMELLLTQTVNILRFVFYGNEQPGPAWLPIGLIAIGGGVTFGRGRGRWLGLYLIAALLIGFAASGFGFLIFDGRYVWYVFPVATLLVATALTLAPRPMWQSVWSSGGRVIGVVLVGLLVVRLPVISNVPFAETEHLGDIIRQVDAQIQADDVVYVYYGASSQFTRYASDTLKRAATLETWARSRPTEIRQANLWQAVSNHNRVWFLTAHVNLQDDVPLRDALASRCRPVEQIELVGAASYLFDCHLPWLGQMWFGNAR